MNSIKLLAYSTSGQRLPEKDQFIRNCPIAELDPEFDAIIIVASDDEKQVSPDPTEFAKSVEQFNKPVVVNGKSYHRAFAWGSAVKGGVTIGLTDDYFAAKGILNFVEDTYRLGRAYLPNSTAALRGQMTVRSYDVGVTIPGVGPIGDGFGYIKRSMYETLDPAYSIVSAGKWNTSASFMQRFQLTGELLLELADTLKQNLELIKSVNFTEVIDAKGIDIGTKADYLGLDDQEIRFHPFIANAVSDARANFAIRTATTGGFLMDGGVFAPTTSFSLVLPDTRFPVSESGEYVATRYPIDSQSSIRVVDAEQTGDEAERIGQMVGLQYTLTVGFEKSFKGMLAVVDDANFPEGVDIIVSVEDLKLDADGEVVKEPAEWSFGDAILSVTQIFDAGSFVGVPEALAKHLGADFDGDQGAFIPGSRFPEMVRQIKENFRDLPNPKLPKTKTPVVVGEPRAENALLSMANLVGIATNVSSTILSMSDQEMIAHQLGFKSEDEMEQYLMLAIKVGTDIFKTSFDWRPVALRLARINTRLQTLGIRAPWLTWLKSDIAFRHELPQVCSYAESLELSSDWGKKNWIEQDDPHQAGFVPALLRLTLPEFEGMPIGTEVRPLSYFRNWVLPTQDKRLKAVVSQMLTAYAERIKSVNFSDHEAWAEVVEKWQAAIDEVVERNSFDRWSFAQALWYACHNTQRHNNLSGLASAIFRGMPEEAKRIVAEKPGKIDGEKVVVTGVQYQLPFATDGIVIRCNTQPFSQPTKGRDVIIRHALVAEKPLAGQIQPKGGNYPANMIGVIALNCGLSGADVVPGDYSFTRSDERTWLATRVS